MDFSSPNPNQIAGYDFPNAKEKVKFEDEVEIQNLFFQFGIDYRSFFSIREKKSKGYWIRIKQERI